MSEPAAEPQVLDRYECLVCGYAYEPPKGDSKHEVFQEHLCRTAAPGAVQFSAKASQFQNIGPVGMASGFQENLSYGLGVNHHQRKRIY